MRRRLEARGREQDAGLTKWRYLGVREVFSARGLDMSGGRVSRASGGDGVGRLELRKFFLQSLAFIPIHDHAGCGIKFGEEVGRHYSFRGHAARFRDLCGLGEVDQVQCHLRIVEGHDCSVLLEARFLYTG
jgi:hypothetical protein